MSFSRSETPIACLCVPTSAAVLNNKATVTSFFSPSGRFSQRRNTTRVAAGSLAPTQNHLDRSSSSSRLAKPTHEVYLATMSLLLLREGEERVLEKIKPIGVGLMHVDATTEKSKIVRPARRSDNFSGAEKRRVVEACDRSVGIRY